jgi:hypothetical protein
LDQPIKSSTMSDVISNSTKYLNLEDGDTNKKRLRNPMLPEIEELEDIIMNFVHLNMRQKPIDSYLIKN